MKTSSAVMNPNLPPFVRLPLRFAALVGRFAALGFALPAPGATLPAVAPAERPVTVTLRADAATLAPGATTVVRAFAQVSPGYRARADRIFTWYLDLLVSTPEQLELDVASLTRPRSDADPVLGSPGIADGASLMGIRDSFLNLEGAGVAAPVELFSIRVLARAPGPGVLRLRPGTLGADDSPDFLVLPSSEEDPWSGGEYAAATTQIVVSDETSGGGTPPRLSLELDSKGTIRVTVQGEPGEVVALEETENLGDRAVWRRVGQSEGRTPEFVHETSALGPVRFYRGLRLSPASGR